MDTLRKAWISLFFLIGTLVVNGLGAFGLINGLSQGEVSKRYMTLITPSPSSFMIWGVIYGLLIVSVITMIVKHKEMYYRHVIENISLLFWISCLFNIGWIVAFSYVMLELSVLFILGIAVSLALLCKKLLTNHEQGRWLLPLTFGLYTGWIVIASVVNIAATLVKLNWNGFGLDERVWAFIILIVAIGLLGYLLMILKNAVLPLPVAWAYLGIYQNLRMQQTFPEEYRWLKIVALLGMGVLIGLAVFQFYRNRFAFLPDKD